EPNGFREVGNGLIVLSLFSVSHSPLVITRLPTGIEFCWILLDRLGSVCDQLVQSIWLRFDGGRLTRLLFVGLIVGLVSGAGHRHRQQADGEQADKTIS